MNKQLSRFIPKTKKQWLIAISVMIGMISLGIYFGTKQQPSDTPVSYSTDTPDESKQNAEQYNWQGAADEPKKIRIEKINVDAYIQKAGIDQNQKVAVPNNVHLAAWFQDSRKPGQTGLSVMSGHVSGPTVDGVFKRLGQLQKGDIFEVELGNGEVKQYKVMSTATVKERESADYVFSQDPKTKSQVNLVTCSGAFDRANNQYEDRTIVAGGLVN